MQRAIIVLGAIAFLATTAAIATSGTRPLRQLEPTTAWRLNYGDERCSLSQQFGIGNQAVLLQIDSYGGWNHFRATLAGTGVPVSVGPAELASLRFPGDPAGREAHLLRGKTSEGEPAASFDLNFVPYEEYERQHKLSKENLQDPQPERSYADYDRTISAFVVAFGAGSTLQLNVHTMAAPLTALRACVDDLNKSRGLNPDVEKKLSRAAVPEQADVVRLQHAYPTAMLKNGVSAIAPMRLMIDANGNPTSCIIQLPTVDPAIKTAICGNLRHFNAALDADGKPVASMYTNSVAFIVAG